MAYADLSALQENRPSERAGRPAARLGAPSLLALLSQLPRVTQRAVQPVALDEPEGRPAGLSGVRRARQDGRLRRTRERSTRLAIDASELGHKVAAHALDLGLDLGHVGLELGHVLLQRPHDPQDRVQGVVLVVIALLKGGHVGRLGLRGC